MVKASEGYIWCENRKAELEIRRAELESVYLDEFLPWDKWKINKLDEEIDNLGQILAYHDKYMTKYGRVN